MTAVAAYVDKKKVIWMGGDAAAVADYALSTLARRKVFVKENMIFGYTNSFRLADILQYCLAIPPRHVGQCAEEYVCASFIPALRAAVSEHGYTGMDNDEEAGGNILVGYQGRIYNIQSDLAVVYRDAPYDAVGCGAELCIGAMHALAGEKRAERRGRDVVLAALRAAEANCAGVRRPFTVKSLSAAGAPEDWPHLPDDLIRQRIARRLAHVGECWVWQGWVSHGRPMLSLGGGRQHPRRAQVNHLLWWLERGERVVLPRFLAHRCPTHLCVCPAHHEAVNRTRLRRWTAREVRLMREAYWGTPARPGARDLGGHRPGAITRTARDMGVSRQAVVRALAGARTRWDKWPGRRASPETMYKLMRRHEGEVAAEEAMARVSVHDLAARHGAAVTVVLKMLRGKTYALAGGPTQRVRQDGQRLDVAAGGGWPHAARFG